MATSKIQAGLRLQADILKKITFIAKKNKRSVNSQIEFIVQECVEKFEKENGIISFDSEE